MEKEEREKQAQKYEAKVQDLNESIISRMDEEKAEREREKEVAIVMTILSPSGIKERKGREEEN